MRTLKMAGLAVVAVLALAFAANAAVAAEFHSESENTTLTGTTEAKSVFDAAGSTIECPHATFEGTSTAKTTSTLTMTANYNPIVEGVKKTCTFFGFSGVEVAMNGCAYIFHASNTVDVECPTGAAITFEAGSCKVKIGAQTGKSKVTYTNLGTGTTQEVTVAPAVEKIKYTSEGLCLKNGTFEDGNYTSGPTKVTGEVTGTTTHTGIWWL